jgi:hypothetical protein
VQHTYNCYIRLFSVYLGLTDSKVLADEQPSVKPMQRRLASAGWQKASDNPKDVNGTAALHSLRRMTQACGKQGEQDKLCTVLGWQPPKKGMPMRCKNTYWVERHLQEQKGACTLGAIQRHANRWRVQCKGAISRLLQLPNHRQAASIATTG